jgi:hypothetical protein
MARKEQGMETPVTGGAREEEVRHSGTVESQGPEEQVRPLNVSGVPEAAKQPETELLYANADKTKLVPAGSEEAAFVIHPDEPGAFKDLVDQHQKGES